MPGACTFTALSSSRLDELSAGLTSAITAARFCAVERRLVGPPAVRVNWKLPPRPLLWQLRQAFIRIGCTFDENIPSDSAVTSTRGTGRSSGAERGASALALDRSR